MKYLLCLQVNKKYSGFTLVEIIISALVLSGLISGLIFIFSRSTDSFNSTLWRQNRLRESEVFWRALRNSFGEATNELEISGTISPEVFETSTKPIRVHSNPADVEDGTLLRWHSSETSFDFDSGSFAHNVEHKNFILQKNERNLRLVERRMQPGTGDPQERVITRVEDVEEISFSLKFVFKDPGNNEEYVDQSAAEGVIGSIITVDIVFAPPEQHKGHAQEIYQSNRFRLNVGATVQNNIDN